MLCYLQVNYHEKFRVIFGIDEAQKTDRVYAFVLAMSMGFNAGTSIFK